MRKREFLPPQVASPRVSNSSCHSSPQWQSEMQVPRQIGFINEQFKSHQLTHDLIMTVPLLASNECCKSSHLCTPQPAPGRDNGPSTCGPHCDGQPCHLASRQSPPSRSILRLGMNGKLRGKLESAAELSNQESLMAKYACTHMANPSLVMVLQQAVSGHSNC